MHREFMQTFVCAQCGKEFRRYLRKPRGKFTYCSQPCHFKHRTRPLSDRFWTHVDRSTPDACWLWTAEIQNNGYGRFRLSERRHLAHRVAWLLTSGPIPEDMCVLHRCDNPPCVNPAHLVLGTRADNNHDRNAKGRQARGDRSGTRSRPEAYRRGSARPTSRLTEAQVADIRRLYEAGGCTFRSLATQFDVGKTTIEAVVKHWYWNHV